MMSDSLTQSVTYVGIELLWQLRNGRLHYRLEEIYIQNICIDFHAPPPYLVLVHHLGRALRSKSNETTH